MRTLSSLATAAILTALLASCTGEVRVEPLPPPYDETVRAVEWTAADLAGMEPRHTETLSPGESIIYRVSVPDTGLDALYLEVDQEVDLIAETMSGNLLAVSDTADYFTADRSTLSASEAASLEPSDIRVGLACRGSCVILSSDRNLVLVEVRNDSGSQVDASLYAYVRDFEDTNEDFGPSDPFRLPTGETAGALERLGDVDYYTVTQDGDLTFDVGTLASGIDYVVEVSGEGFTDTIEVGESIPVFAGDDVRVYAGNESDRAGSAGKSRYVLSFDASF